MLSFLSVISFASLPVAAIPATVPATPVSGTASSAEVANGVLTTASRYLGTRYRFGGARPDAFDCSGFVRYVFARHGVALPRTAREQAAIGQPVAGGLDSLRVGDLLFFATRRGRAGHVAIYVGEGRIIHASAGSRRVRYDNLSSTRGRWFITHLSSLRRVIGESDAGSAGTRGQAVPRVVGADSQG
jgi:cell wall-associated NlpC family hydrolase